MKLCERNTEVAGETLRTEPMERQSLVLNFCFQKQKTKMCGGAGRRVGLLVIFLFYRLRFSRSFKHLVRCFYKKF